MIPTKAEKVEALKKSIDTSIATLSNAVDEVRASEAFKAYLSTQARFHNYSFGNIMLIMGQFSTASQVAGYQTWKKLQHQVKKGSKGIAIFAPRSFTKEVVKDGKTVEETGMYFRVVHVFDVSQTDGPELPTFDVPTVEQAADTVLAAMNKVADKRDIPITYAPIDDLVLGRSWGGRVDIDNTHTTGQQAKTLAHELAHEALHQEDRGELTRTIAELEAESVAYVVCAHFGLDVAVRASRYIALWSGDSKALRESLKRISDTARNIIDDAVAPKMLTDAA